MTDLHCHILPGMDDGAKDTAVSLELLRREYEDGVRNIAFTSHFNSERTTVEAFTAKRQAAFEQLTAALEGQPMQFDFKLGAEVFFSPGLCELDTRALCMGDTAYLLLEFPTTHKPHFIRQTLYNLQQQGIVPLIAHIERYPYVLEDPTLLYDWVAAGAYAQINAGALLEPKLCKKLCKFIQWGLVHVISTDTHSPDKRPPRMAQGVQQLEKLLGKCDAIKECIVKEMGKKIGTVVCCEDDKQQQVKAFVTELNRTLPMYKRISVVECSAEPLPRNALGKLLRR